MFDLLIFLVEQSASCKDERTDGQTGTSCLKGLDVFQTKRVLPGIFQHHLQPGERFAALHRHDRAPEAGPVAGRIDVTGGIIDKGLQTCSDSNHNGREWTS